MDTILEHLIPFSRKEPPEGIDLFVCQETDTVRSYGIMRFFRKGSVLPKGRGGCSRTPEEWLLEQIFHEFSGVEVAPETAFYRFVRRRRGDAEPGVWVKSAINPLDASYIAINPEELG